MPDDLKTMREAADFLKEDLERRFAEAEEGTEK